MVKLISYEFRFYSVPYKYYSVRWNVIQYRGQPDFPSVDYKLNFKASVHLMQFQLSFVLLKI